MAFIELTYDLARYAGVTGETFPLSFFSLFLLDEVTPGAAGSVVGVALHSVVVGREANQVLAWYKKFNLCIMSLLGTL